MSGYAHRCIFSERLLSELFYRTGHLQRLQRFYLRPAGVARGHSNDSFCFLGRSQGQAEIGAERANHGCGEPFSAYVGWHWINAKLAMPLVILSILTFSVGGSLQGASWFALLSPIVPAAIRGHFFGRLRRNSILSWNRCELYSRLRDSPALKEAAAPQYGLVDLLNSCDHVMGRTKQKSLACFDAFLALIMK